MYNPYSQCNGLENRSALTTKMGQDYVQRKHAKKKRKTAAKKGGVSKPKKGKIPGKLKGMCYRDPVLTKEDLKWRADNEDMLEKLQQKRLLNKGVKRKRVEQETAEQGQEYKVMVKLPFGCTPEDQTVKVVQPLIGASSVEVPHFKKYHQRIIWYMQYMRYIEETEVQSICWDLQKVKKKNLIICAPPKSGTTTAYILAMMALEIKNFGIVLDNMENFDTFQKQGNQVAKFSGKKLERLNNLRNGGTNQSSLNSSEIQKIDVILVGTLEQFLKFPNLVQFQYLIFDNILTLQSLEFKEQIQRLQKTAPNILLWFFVNQNFDFLQVQSFGIQKAVKQKFENNSPKRIGKWVEQRVVVCADHKKIVRLINWFRTTFSAKNKLSNYADESKHEIQTDTGKRCIILVKDISTIAVVKKCVESLDFGACILHGKRNSQAKDQAILNFKNNTTPILIATGKAYYANYLLHSVKVPYLINFDFPSCMEDYIWRVGLTGPLSSFGRCFSFFTRQLAQISAPLIQFLEECDQPVDDGLRKLENAFELASKVKQEEMENSDSDNQQINNDNDNKQIKKKKIIIKNKWLRVLRLRRNLSI
eukprot:TRINITY_DN4566_c0_g1_i3.p1 TRINITY_DN4566_c0_g1~~TRINITY_DN4566_c0_g1_i3.p1  ORF type:complete len:589 (-),score=69.39 TRINITY_DN4566_c0_g1_i3:206-1972(-)